ncbi:Holliday junction resolvase RecU [Sporolactobacillus shoreicorticis]|nr:Holliday junction resolvase RecU [Sporolactobacillus shoreicorticis]
MLKKMAVVQKVATPLKKTKNSAFYSEKSTVDFIGCLNGRGLAFDAKETKRPSLPLANVHEHQTRYLMRYRDCGGHAFLLVRFIKQNETFILPIKEFKKFVDAVPNGGRKSIPYGWFVENCVTVWSRNGIVLDYLLPIRTGKVTA